MEVTGMPKIRVHTDELYPHYTVDERDFGKEVAVSPAFYRRYLLARTEYFALQDVLEKLQNGIPVVESTTSNLS
jgi:hypothetical protein